MLHKLDAALLCAKTAFETRMREFLTKEDGDVNIISIVVLIGIVIIIAGIFRKQIAGLVNTLFESIGTSAEKAITE